MCQVCCPNPLTVDQPVPGPACGPARPEAAAAAGPRAPRAGPASAGGTSMQHYCRRSVYYPNIFNCFSDFLSFTKFSKIKFDTFGQFSFRNIINFSLVSSCYPTAAGPLRRLGLRLGRGLGAGRALLPLDLDLGRREARLGCK